MRILRLTLAGTLTLSPRSWRTLVRLDRQWGDRMRIRCAILCTRGMAMVQAALGAWWLGRRPEPEPSADRANGRHLGSLTLGAEPLLWLLRSARGMGRKVHWMGVHLRSLPLLR